MTAAPAAHGFAQISGAPVFYEVVGAGRPLVLLHEGFADSRMFDDQVAAFAAHAQVIRYDRHGSGRSGVPSVPYTDHDVLHDLLRHLGVERAAILGMSAGGGVAIDFTLVYPAMVDALIPVAAVIGGYAGSDATSRQWAEIGAALAAGDVQAGVELTLRMWVDGPKWRADQVDPAVRGRIQEMMSHFFTRQQGEPRPLEPPSVTRLAEIAVPTLIIVGDGDVPDILDQAELLHQAIPGAEKATIPDVAHVLNMERPERFNRLTLDFLHRRQIAGRRSNASGGALSGYPTE